VGVQLQIRRTTKAYSDDGNGRRVRKTKSQRDTAPKVREVPFPPKVAQRFVYLHVSRLGVDHTRIVSTTFTREQCGTIGRMVSFHWTIG
jgi:hypothetical protein